VSAYLPVLVAVAALGLTYAFCIRPMRRGSCGHGQGWSARGRAHELELARSELELLRLRQTAHDRREQR
jgi:hypothetical protein